jgi:CubicO group peptidase (beta-lactamase class C family)
MTCHTSLPIRFVSILVLIVLHLAPTLAVAGDRSIGQLLDHLEQVVPALLEETGVPGAAVGVVRDGRVVYLAGFGSAGGEHAGRVTPATLFNVGSISKTITAWGAMSLVESGAMGLETPVGDLLARWPLVDGPDAERVTIGQLLSHTSGLTGASVPEYLPWEETPTVADWLASGDSGVRLATPPGEDWSYSGAGYSVLQLAMERAAGEPFNDLMYREVLEPLGMLSSTFAMPASHDRLARPHEEGHPIPYRRYPGQAAAGLYMSLADLTRFLSAHAASEERAPGNGVVSPRALDHMRAPLPLSRSRFGTYYGLGYSLWPLADGALTSGHRGQNHGWAAVAWLSADGRDGLAVLTNDSNGEDVYRWILCDWAHWLVGEAAFGGYCSDRKSHPAGPLFSETVGGDPSLSRLIRQRASASGPGLAALVARQGEILLREAHGLSNLETGTVLTPSTPFYIASLAKPLTATLVLDLVERGDLALDDRIDGLLPGFPHFGRPVTIRQLLGHTSGTPDFWELYDWRNPVALDNDTLLHLVAEEGEPGFSPGDRFAYSNTGWLGLASLAENATGRRYSDLLMELLGAPPSSSELLVFDDPHLDLPQRARGYSWRGGKPRLVDYRRLELPGLAPVEPGFSTVGAGGVVANVDGLHRWATALLDGDLLPAPLSRLMTAGGPRATGIEGFGGAPRAGLGLFVNELGGRELWWHDGSLFGHRSLMVIEPASESVVILLANSSEIELRELAGEILTEIVRPW